MVTNWDVGDGYAFGYKRNNPKKKGKFPTLLVQKCLENKGLFAFFIFFKNIKKLHIYKYIYIYILI